MKNTHKCKYMNNDQFPNGQNPNYVYKWTGDEAGWQLFTNDKPITGNSYSWVCNCNWCSEALEVIDLLPPLDQYRGHRCNQIIQHEWRHKQCESEGFDDDDGFDDGGGDDDEQQPVAHQKTMCCFAIIWDGYAWNMMNGDEVISKRLRECPHCCKILKDPRLFQNKVEIT